MNDEMRTETLTEQKVSYILEFNGKIFVIENVPARVCLETGERFFAPATVEQLQKTIWESENPKRVIEAKVFEFAA